MQKELQALKLLLCFPMRTGSRVPGEQGGRVGSLQARAAGRPAQTSRFDLLSDQPVQKETAGVTKHGT